MCGRPAGYVRRGAPCVRGFGDMCGICACGKKRGVREICPGMCGSPWVCAGTSIPHKAAQTDGHPATRALKACSHWLGVCAWPILARPGVRSCSGGGCILQMGGVDHCRGALEACAARRKTYNKMGPHILPHISPKKGFAHIPKKRLRTYPRQSFRTSPPPHISLSSLYGAVFASARYIYIYKYVYVYISL